MIPQAGWWPFPPRPPPRVGTAADSALRRSSQYGMVAGAGRENGMEAPMHENPEWEKARQALASISKAGAAGSSKASSNGPVASSQVRRPRGLGTLRGRRVAGGGTAWYPLESPHQSAPRVEEAGPFREGPGCQCPRP